MPQGRAATAALLVLLAIAVSAKSEATSKGWGNCAPSLLHVAADQLTMPSRMQLQKQPLFVLAKFCCCSLYSLAKQQFVLPDSPSSRTWTNSSWALACILLTSYYTFCSVLVATTIMGYRSWLSHVRRLKQVTDSAVCPDGCAPKSCQDSGTGGGLRCVMCLNNLFVDKATGMCGEQHPTATCKMCKNMRCTHLQLTMMGGGSRRCRTAGTVHSCSSPDSWHNAQGSRYSHLECRCLLVHPDLPQPVLADLLCSSL